MSDTTQKAEVPLFRDSRSLRSRGSVRQSGFSAASAGRLCVGRRLRVEVRFPDRPGGGELLQVILRKAVIVEKTGSARGEKLSLQFSVEVAFLCEICFLEQFFHAALHFDTSP